MVEKFVKRIEYELSLLNNRKKVYTKWYNRSINKCARNGYEVRIDSLEKRISRLKYFLEFAKSAEEIKASIEMRFKIIQLRVQFLILGYEPENTLEDNQVCSDVRVNGNGLNAKAYLNEYAKESRGRYTTIFPDPDGFYQQMVEDAVIAKNNRT
jgi:hypothetical protein